MAVQNWNPDRYVRQAGFVADLGAPLLDMLAPGADERILDLGCGDGRLTRDLAARAGAVLAIDSSPEQVAAARAAGLDAMVGDGETLSFSAEFDAVFSNAALHWMRDADAVLRGVRRALKPGGRFVAEMGGKGNCAAVRTALHQMLARRGIDPLAHDPWYFPDEQEYAAKLTAHGFGIDTIMLFARPTPLPGDITGWLSVFAGVFLGALAEAERAPAYHELREALAGALCDGQGNWHVDYVRLRFSARLA